MKIRPVGAELLLHADTRTDTKQTVAVRNVANEPKKKPRVTVFRIQYLMPQGAPVHPIKQ